MPEPARAAGRRRAAALLVLGVLALHAWFIAGAPFGPHAPPPPGRGGALQVRMVSPAVPAVVQPPVPADAAPPADGAPAVAPSPRVPPAPSPVPRPSAAAAAVTAAASTPAVAAPSAAGSAPPLYPTRLPPTGEWAYVLQRNGRGGSARLSWQHDGERYSAQLDSADAQLQWQSQGGLDDAGLRPERFVDRRDRRRDAANFELDAGRIGYSGNGADQPAWRGSQDRLSLLLQLAAILDARRYSPAAGEVFVVHVSGARGDAALWRFEVQGPERLVLPDGRQRFALKLLREPTQPYDTRAEVWTDPAAHHLPLRLRLTNGAHVLELLMAAPPEAP